MLNIIELMNFLNGKSNNMDEYINSLNTIKRLENKLYSEYKFSVSNYSYNDSLNQLIFCLIMIGLLFEVKLDDKNELLDIIDEYNRIGVILDHDKIKNYKNNLIEKVSNYENSSYEINIKKIIQYINNNEYNHELILILASLYDVNIFIFNKDVNLFKVYYPEEEYYTCKKNIFLQYNKDIYTNMNTLQILSLNNSNMILEWKDISKLILENTQNIYPIGFNENKRFTINHEKKTKQEYIVKKSNNELKLSMVLQTNEITDMEFYNKILKKNNKSNI